MTESKEREQSSTKIIDTSDNCCYNYNDTTHFLVSFPWLLLWTELDFDSHGLVPGTILGSDDL